MTLKWAVPNDDYHFNIKYLKFDASNPSHKKGFVVMTKYLQGCVLFYFNLSEIIYCTTARCYLKLHFLLYRLITSQFF